MIIGVQDDHRHYLAQLVRPKSGKLITATSSTRAARAFPTGPYRVDEPLDLIASLWLLALEVLIRHHRTVSNAWFALIGALGGVALGAVISLVITAALTNRWQMSERQSMQAFEENHRLRSERRDASIGFLDASDACYRAAFGVWRRRSTTPDLPIRAVGKPSATR